jgi:hypothetical protein
MTEPDGLSRAFAPLAALSGCGILDLHQDNGTRSAQAASIAAIEEKAMA